MVLFIPFVLLVNTWSFYSHSPELPWFRVIISKFEACRTEPLPSNDKIPRNLLQTSPVSYEELSPQLQKLSDSWLCSNPDLERTVYTDDMIELFMKENVSPRFFTAFQKLPLPVMKADFWRYVAVWVNGGVYADTDAYSYVPFARWLSPECDVIIALERYTFFVQYILVSTARHPLFKRVVEYVGNRVEEMVNSDEKFTEQTVHLTTGPAVFTKAVASFLLDRDVPLDSPITAEDMYTDPLAISNAKKHRVCLKSKNFFRGIIAAQEGASDHFVGTLAGGKEYPSWKDQLGNHISKGKG